MNARVYGNYLESNAESPLNTASLDARTRTSKQNTGLYDPCDQENNLRDAMLYETVLKPIYNDFRTRGQREPSRHQHSTPPCVETTALWAVLATPSRASCFTLTGELADA